MEAQSADVESGEFRFQKWQVTKTNKVILKALDR